MNKYVKTTKTYVKEGHEMDIVTHICTCGGNILDIVTIDTESPFEYTYLGQCVKCKNIFSENHCFDKYSNGELEQGGWKLKK